MWLFLLVQQISLSVLVALTPCLIGRKTPTKVSKIMRFTSMPVAPMRAVAKTLPPVKEQGNLEKYRRANFFALVVAGPSVAPNVCMEHDTLENVSC